MISEMNDALVQLGLAEDNKNPDAAPGVNVNVAVPKSQVRSHVILAWRWIRLISAPSTLEYSRLS